MVLVLPVSIALFGFLAYRKITALPPLWYLRAATMQSDGLMDFVLPVVGAAAWTGSREGRCHMADLLTGTAQPRATRQLAAWAATAAWAVAGYAACVGLLYLVTARQAPWGGPLWWPVAVDLCAIVALSAIGFAAGAFFPSRFTAPIATLGVFLALGFSTQPISGASSPWDISPIVNAPWDFGNSAGIGTFYHYLPDLSIAQVMFLVGLTMAVVAALGLPGGSAGRRARQLASTFVAAGLAAVVVALALAGTGRMGAQGMIAIPALHDAASDIPISYTAVCSQEIVPVCLNPAYATYLPVVSSALAPVLDEVAGLPGAPVRLSQANAAYAQGRGNSVGVIASGPIISGTPPAVHFILPDQAPEAPSATSAEFAAQVAGTLGPSILQSVVGDAPGPGASPAQQAVMLALLKVASLPYVPGPTPGLPAVSPRAHLPEPVLAAARRFAELSAGARHAWLMGHVVALRAGQVPLAQLP
jgi:hypothetical protein